MILAFFEAYYIATLPNGSVLPNVRGGIGGVGFVQLSQSEYSPKLFRNKGAAKTSAMWALGEYVDLKDPRPGLITHADHVDTIRHEYPEVVSVPKRKLIRNRKREDQVRIVRVRLALAP